MQWRFIRRHPGSFVEDISRDNFLPSVERTGKFFVSGISSEPERNYA